MGIPISILTQFLSGGACAQTIIHAGELSADSFVEEFTLEPAVTGTQVLIR